MSSPIDFDYTRYLAAKKSLDERSYNVRVWESLLDIVNRGEERRLRVLEAGAGIGSTMVRFLQCVGHCDITYTLLDVEASHFEYLRSNVSQWLGELGFSRIDDGLQFRRGCQKLEIHLVLEDVNRYIVRPEKEGFFDVLIAQAFLDLFHIDTLVPGMLSLLAPGGAFYFPINFDDLSVFLPPLDPELDRAIVDRFHASMNDRAPARQTAPRSQTGRRLIPLLQGLDVVLAAIGSSDWVVFADAQHRYGGDEAYFLAQILYFVEQELRGFDGITADEAADWLSRRHEQLRAGTLVYIAHQLDVAGVKPD